MKTTDLNLIGSSGLAFSFLRLRISLTLLLLASLVFLLAACSDAPSQSKALKYLPSNSEQIVRYRFAVHPLYNPGRLFEVYQPLINLINAQASGWMVELEASDDYQDYERKFRNKGPDILLPNPWHTLEAIKLDYRVVAQAGSPEDFRGLLLVRKADKIASFADLKGKTVSYPSYTALAACLMPQYFLFENDVDVSRDIKNIYVGSQESSIMNVVLGQSDVGVTWPPPWRMFQERYPKEAAQLEVKWQTPSMINNSVMVRNGLPDHVVQILTKVLYGLGDSEQGRQALRSMSTERFTPATDADYEVVGEFIRRFEQSVRPVEITMSASLK